MAYAPLNCHQALFSFANCFTVVIILIAPYYNNAMIKISVSPLGCYGIINLFGFLSLCFLKKNYLIL